ncbi:hypothetical protein Pfo_016978 [Paulownia fortunei]|nr:hypothetical protein Pfo_016978 [Paulownia fortunei]
MAKGPKLRLSFLNSIQICRPQDPSSLVKSPLPAATYFSPVNSKSLNISFPSFPDPPPSLPNHLSTKPNFGSSKITPLVCGSRSKSCIMHGMASGLNDKFSSHAYSKTRKEDEEKMYNSPFSSDSIERACPIAPSRIEKKKEKTMTKKPKAKVNTRISLADDDEPDSFSSPPSFNSCHDFNNPLRTVTEKEPKKSEKQRSVRTRRFKRYGSKDWKDDSMTAPENESQEQKPVTRRLVPCMVDKKVNQSFVVVKRSVDPYEDFKKSMLDIILEKQMFEPKELEQLLMNFLSLNSRLHHKAILKAFTEIWKEVFSGSSN